MPVEPSMIIMAVTPAPTVTALRPHRTAPPIIVHVKMRGVFLPVIRPVI